MLRKEPYLLHEFVFLFTIILLLGCTNTLGYYLECKSCLDDEGGVWCALSQTCVSSETECTNPFEGYRTSSSIAFSAVNWMIPTKDVYNVTNTKVAKIISNLFTGQDETQNRTMYKLPNYCYTGIVTNSSDCSNIKLEIHRSYSSSVRNLVFPIWFQPHLKFANETPLGYSFKDMKKAFQTGYFYAPIFPIQSRKNDSFSNSVDNGKTLDSLWSGISSNNYSEKIAKLSYLSGYDNTSSLFSYLFHVFNSHNHEVFFDSEKNWFRFLDLSIAAKSNKYYRMGFSFAAPKSDLSQFTYASESPLEENDPELLGSQYQCTFVLADQIIYAEAYWVFTVSGAHIFLSIAVLTVIGIWTTIIICLNKRFFEEDMETNFTRTFDIKKTIIPSGKSLVWQKLGRLYDMIRAYAIANDNDIAKEVGSESYYYFWFLRFIILYIVICGAYSIITLVPIYASQAPTSWISFLDYSKYTAATLTVGRQGEHVFLIFVILNSFFICLGGAILLYALKHEARVFVTDKVITDDKVLSATIRHFGHLYTLMISNIPKEITSQEELGELFNEEILGGKYRNDDEWKLHYVCHVAVNLNHLAALDQDLLKVEEKLEKIKPDDPPKTGCIAKCTPTEEQLLQEKSQILEKISTIKKKYYINETMENDAFLTTGAFNTNEPATDIYGTGFGFVTFFSMDEAAEVLQNFNNSRSKVTKLMEYFIPFYQDKKLTVQAAPPPDDVIFNNFSISHTKRKLRLIGINTGLFCAMLLVFFILGVGSVSQWLKQEFLTFVIDFAESLQIAGMVDLFRILVDLSMEIPGLFMELLKLVVVVGANAVGYYSKTHYSLYVSGKMLFFMLASTLVFPYFTKYFFLNTIISYSNYINHYPLFSNLIIYFEFFGLDIINLLFIFSFIAKTIEYSIQLVTTIITLSIKKTMVRIPFDYEVNYGFKSAILIFVIFYGAVTPFVYLAGLVFFGFSYMLERHLIMFVYRKGKQSNGHLLSKVASDISQYMVLIPIAYIVFFPFSLKYIISNTEYSVIPYLYIILSIGCSAILYMIYFIIRKVLRLKAHKVFLKKFEETREKGIFKAAIDLIPINSHSLEHNISMIGLNRLKTIDNNYVKVKKNQTVPALESDVSKSQPQSAISNLKNEVANLINMGKLESLENEDIVNLVHKSQLLDLYRHPYFIEEAKKLKKKFRNAMRAALFVTNQSAAAQNDVTISILPKDNQQ